MVLLAAGLDTRAFRLACPSGVTVFEIDQPQVIAFRDEVLRDQGVQASPGFTADLSTAWVAEGLLAYLPPEAEERLEMASLVDTSARRDCAQ